MKALLWIIAGGLGGFGGAHLLDGHVIEGAMLVVASVLFAIGSQGYSR